jgi:SAM-dependent methyltransferase
VSSQPLEDLLARLERERLEADRLYNEALTAVNRAIQSPPDRFAPVAPPDDSRLPELNEQWRITTSAPPVERGWRGRARAFVWQLVGPALAAQQQFNTTAVDHLNRQVASERALVERISAVATALQQAREGLFRFQSLLVQYLMTITAFVDTRDRRLGAEGIADRLTFVEQRLAALGREVDRLQSARVSTPVVGTTPAARAEDSAPAFSAPVDSATYVGFEDRFRGSQDVIRKRVEDYVPLFTSAVDVVDVGSGRGELLDALRARGIRARGVDANRAMVDTCRARGLDVEESDALAFLERQPPASLGGLVALQVVEHFAPAYLIAFLGAAHQALRPGAPLVVETINPACWAAFFDTYIRDLTHQRPLHPETLKYLIEASGFSHVDVSFREPMRESDRLDRVHEAPAATDSAMLRDLVAVVNAHADKLNTRLFSSFDYAIVAKR